MSAAVLEDFLSPLRQLPYIGKFCVERKAHHVAPAVFAEDAERERHLDSGEEATRNEIHLHAPTLAPPNDILERLEKIRRNQEGRLGEIGQDAMCAIEELIEDVKLVGRVAYDMCAYNVPCAKHMS